MIEYWDLLLPDGTPTGETMPSNQRIPDDRCTLVVHCFIANQSGQFLLQKRSMKKKYFPGIWDGTGGRVLAGETGREAMVRELQEELGLMAQPEDLQLIDCYKLPWRNFFEIYAVKLDFTLSDCFRQEEEVDELALLPYEDAVRLLKEHKDSPDNDAYFAAFSRANALLNESSKIPCL